MRNRASGYVEQNFNEKETERFRLEIGNFLEQYELDSARKSVLFPDTIPALEEPRELEARGAKAGFKLVKA
jgi:hypothetical protein